jgi:hypothetical protein
MNARVGLSLLAPVTITTAAHALPPPSNVQAGKAACRWATIGTATPATPGGKVYINGCAFGASGGITGRAFLTGKFPGIGSQIVLTNAGWSDTSITMLVPANIRGALPQDATITVHTDGGTEATSPISFVPMEEVIELDPGKTSVKAVCSTASSGDNCPAPIPGNIALIGEHRSYIGKGPQGQDEFDFNLRNGWKLTDVRISLQQGGEGGYVTTSIHPVEQNILVIWHIGGIASIRYSGVVKIRGPAGVPY